MLPEIVHANEFQTVVISNIFLFQIEVDGRLVTIKLPYLLKKATLIKRLAEFEIGKEEFSIESMIYTALSDLENEEFDRELMARKRRKTEEFIDQ